MNSEEKKCPHCGKSILADSVFCRFCGERITTEEKDKELICPQCGKKLPDDSEFCQFCGSNIRFVESDQNNKQQTSTDSFDQKVQEQPKTTTDSNKSTLKNSKVISFLAKKKKMVILIALGIIVAVFLGIVIVNYNNKVAYNNQPRNMATETMDDKYTNVYADVLSIDPIYYVSEYKTTKYGTRVGDEGIRYIVCKCKTKEGPYIWASIFYGDFPKGAWSNNPNDYHKLSYDYSNPKRLRGHPTAAQKVHEDLDAAIGDILVLYVDKIE